MSDLVIVHRSHKMSRPAAYSFQGVDVSQDPSFLMWETCRRQIFFSEEIYGRDFSLSETDELYQGLDAEEFLIEVLCGLKSPLVGETEVFGQFKNWWQNLEDQDFKNKFSPRIQHIYSVVKKVRDEALCGMGSQSYGSLLRKKLTDRALAKVQTEPVVIDFIGAGQLVEEMIPWIQKKYSYRIWCRDVEKVKQKSFGAQALEVLPMDSATPLSSVVVVAAPLTHSSLQKWMGAQPTNAQLAVYDFRHDSMAFIPSVQIAHYSHLDHFATEVESQRQEIQNHISRAYTRIENWKAEENARAQIRPFGWDDL
ncbi:hypothetical protein [Pseudobdellovibrio exovorus]|uniref:Glutamyl-tRNA reductase N-terminal domain-containing protein n=1 Tax=Pseudobdellovibrio exovorus JSS TaxID=1184267 RepID=M4V9J7_9BACT|nr:hypothetical protein [Pseudobdellovibrio exovorus]AGH95893.1 hypothetical protein A11Q_1677 [Pseudobdellovibrio exovorus JSS]